MPRIDWLAIAPEVVVAAALLVVLAVDLFLPRERKYWVAALAVVGTTLAMVPVILMAVSGDTYSMFDGSYVVDEFALVLMGALDHRLPFGQVYRPGIDSQVPADVIAQAFLLQMHRQAVDVRKCRQRNHRVDVDVAEQGDLLAGGGAERLLAAAGDDFGQDTDRPQRGHRMLGRLGLELARRTESRHVGQMDVHDVLLADVPLELAQRLDERQALHVADGAADLDHQHLSAKGLLLAQDPRLDRIGHVRDDLDGPAQEIAPALAPDYLRVHLPAGRVAVGGLVYVGEEFVVPLIKVGVGTVISYDHLAVLGRIHRAGIDVQIGVELDVDHAQATGLEDSPD